jgi:hypothetical protein
MKDDGYIHTSYIAAVVLEKDTTYIYVKFKFFLFRKSDQSRTIDMLNVIGGLSRRENMHDEYEYMFMCPAETKQLFLSFYNITGREKKEEKKKRYSLMK